MQRDSERAWLAAAEQQLHAREQALEEKLAAFDKQCHRLQRRQEEVVQRESAVGQREAAVVAVSMHFSYKAMATFVPSCRVGLREMTLRQQLYWSVCF